MTTTPTFTTTRFLQSFIARHDFISSGIVALSDKYYFDKKANPWESVAKYLVSAGIADPLKANINITNPATGANAQEVFAYQIAEGYRAQIQEKDVYTAIVGSGIEYYNSKSFNKTGMTAGKYVAAGIAGKLVNSMIPRKIEPTV